jgi:16S rRNA (guanine527-N7)-methyltransferase
LCGFTYLFHVEQERALRDFLVTSASGLGIRLTDQQARQFLVYLSQLLKWNQTTNLTSITNPYEVISKHFVDSLAALNALKFPFEAVVIDVGSGAGLPGIPLKIVRADLRLLLVEPSLKKSSFISSIVGTLKLEAVSVFAGAVDRYAVQEPRRLADVVVVRALRIEVIAGPAALILKPNGHLLLYRTERLDESLSSAFLVESNYDYALPKQHGRRVVSVLTKSA